MNITPSDTDVRQGFSLAESAATVQVASQTQWSTTPNTQHANLTSQASSGTDERSQAIAASADKTSALEAAQKLEKQLRQTDIGLKIRVLDDSQNRVQVEIVDEKSNKVLRKIPQDELLKLSASIKEMSGVLLNNPA